MSHLLSKRKMLQLADSLVKKTNFNKFEIECLLKKYREITKNRHKLDRLGFRDVLHNCFSITDDIILDRVFKAFDQDNDGNISSEEWVRGLSVFLRGDKKEKTKFAFEVYDLNSDGIISNEEMFQLLKTTIIHTNQSADEDPDEGVKDLVEFTLKLLDANQDGKVDRQDFEQVTDKDGLMIELLGTCLPSEPSVANFEATFLVEG